jgi:hypothetical protein
MLYKLSIFYGSHNLKSIHLLGTAKQHVFRDPNLEVFLAQKKKTRGVLQVKDSFKTTKQQPSSTLQYLLSIKKKMVSF